MSELLLTKAQLQSRLADELRTADDLEAKLAAAMESGNYAEQFRLEGKAKACTERLAVLNSQLSKAI